MIDTILFTGMHRDSQGLDTGLATIGAPGFRVRLQLIAGDFCAIVVAHLERDVPVPSPA